MFRSPCFGVVVSSAAVITTGILQPSGTGDDGLDPTFSEAGVGSDGKTTFVASQSVSGLVEDCEHYLLL
jgi:hypothetical protein